MIPNNRQLDAASEALAEVLAFEHPADGVLSGFFRNHKTLGVRDRAFVAETVYGVLRRLRSVRRWLTSLKRPTARQHVLVWLNQISQISLKDLEVVCKPHELSWLGGLAEAEQPAGDAEQLDVPDWLYERLVAEGQEPPALAACLTALNQPAPLDLRVNTLKGERDKVLALLQQERMSVEPGRYSPFALRMTGKPALHKNPLFTEGIIEVQDEGSQILGLLLAPRRGEMVVDFCAGAGGKTLLLGMLMRSTGRLYAFDVSEKRLARLKPRAARAGLSNLHPVVIASENDVRVKRLAGKCDRVLVDAPCSGLGTLRRNPDLKWRQTPEAVDELVVKQQAILKSAARLVKPGGRLVYATCSILRAENEDVVNAFLAAHPDFELEPAGAILERALSAPLTLDGPCLRLYPHVHGTDGFFAAALVRKAG